MAEQAGGMKKTLGLTGVTVNAMALIAPGAFLWMTFQLQAANIDASGASTAQDMWTGIVAALIVAFLTAISFAELARRYPDAGTGSAYYFAEKAFLDRKEPSHRRWARIAKFITGWAAHLFYWVYPGVMVAFMATLLTYIASQFGIQYSAARPDRDCPGVCRTGRLHRRARHQRLDHGQHRDQRDSARHAGDLQRAGDPVPRAESVRGRARWLVPADGGFDRHSAQPDGHAFPIDHRDLDPGRF